MGSIYDFKATSFNDDPDRSYNIEFDAFANLTEYGYQAEIRIPISSLNFPDAYSQKWKVAFYRKLYNRDNEAEYLSHKVVEGYTSYVNQINSMNCGSKEDKKDYTIHNSKFS